MYEAKPWVKYYDYNVPHTIQFPKIPVQSLVHLAATMFPRKAATNIYGSTMTFRQIRSQMLRLSNALIKMGVKKGDRVGLALPNCPQYIVAYYATLSAGAIVVNMNPLYTHDELKFMMENSGLQTLFTFDTVLPVMRPLAKELGLKNVIITKVTDYIQGFPVSTAKSLELEEGWKHFSELVESSTDESMPRVAVTSEDPALIQFTGGTTGLPKGALLTHFNLIAGTLQGSLWGNSITTYIPHAQRAVIAAIPYFHIYGNTFSMNWGMFNAATQVMFPRFELEEFMAVLAGVDEITYFPTVPTMVTAIVNHPKAAEMDLGAKIRLLSTGGAPMPVELIQRVKDIGIFFNEGWGMSETASVGISIPILRHKPGSIGCPYPGNDVRLVDIETGLNDVKPGEPGEILLKGPTVMKEYWQNPEETANQLKDGWLSTGDIAQMDEDGYFYIVDRKKDMIIAGGFNIYPREVDEVLYQHPKVAEAISAGVPDTYRGETVKAFIVLKPGQEATEKEIIDFCKQKLAPYKVPKLIEFRKELPKSAVGKILRKILRDEELSKSKK
ncbi:MAG TPA: long-chain fatty acid--CoA ligase [Smithellaceae bacterium]|nr:long-chain fatty acid--CoA ligase [Smithellaceae bacterium]HRS82076.1 long-chain fatty acid--CoA ligase [Smithellaceae bacterium]HRV43775.1 long-chain fatty acid--CoA ligase [Smithellaceae bacterium]